MLPGLLLYIRKQANKKREERKSKMADKVRDYGQLAKDIIREVGGKKNIVNATRCATRLRLVLTETPEGAAAKIMAMPGVITVVEKGGQFQVVIGNHVGDVFEVVAKELGLGSSDQMEEAEVKQSIPNRIIATMSGVFAPIVYLLAGSGMIQGVLIIIKTFWPEAANAGTFQIFDLMSWAPFTFLPVLLAVTAARHFKCDQFTAMACSFALLSPTFTSILEQISAGEKFTLFGIRLAETSYASTVLPAIIMVWALSHLEKFVKKRLPDVVKQILTPLICFAVIVPLTLLIIGPISETVANGIAAAYNFLNVHVPVLTAGIFGGFWEVLVIFGVHWGMNPIMLADLGVNGNYTMGVYVAAAVASQMGAVFGVAVKSRNKEMKNMSASAGITAIFGITEPTVYGVTLRLKKPFICACIASAVACMAAGLLQSTYYAYAGLPGPITFINALGDGDTRSLIGAVVSTLIAVVGAFILVQIVGFDDPADESEPAVSKETESREAALSEKKDADAQDASSSDAADGKEEIASPMRGELVPLDQISDAVFASGAMGQGAAVIPAEGKVYAPADGTVSMLFDTLHAIGMTTDGGAELLIHVGMDTVKLDGKYFTPYTESGAKVKKGDLLLEFDMDKIREAGYELTTPVIVTNTDEFEAVETAGPGAVNSGDVIIKIR